MTWRPEQVECVECGNVTTTYVSDETLAAMWPVEGWHSFVADDGAIRFACDGHRTAVAG